MPFSSRPVALVLAALALVGCPSDGDDHAYAPSPVPAAGGNVIPTPKESVYEAPRVTIDQVLASQDAGEDMIMVDVRGVESFGFEHIKGAQSFPWGDLDKIHTKIPRNKKLVLYCA